MSSAESRDRPRVLFVTCHLPWPANSGGRRRELELLMRLKPRFDVHLVVISKTPEQDSANAHQMRRFCANVEVFPAAAEGEDENLPSQVRRHRSPAASGRIREIVTRHHVDLVHVEGFYLMQHVPDWVDAPVLLVEQNVEYDLERQRAAIAIPRGLQSFLQCVRTREAEIECWRRADCVAAVTPEDRDMIRSVVPDAPIRLVPDGADHLPRPRSRPAVSAVPRPDQPLLAFVANFAYAPNVDAAQHLCREVMPLLEQEVPDAHLWLVGNAPPDAIRALETARIRVTGGVPDVVPYLDAADVIVCPLRIGGGIKVKVIEALRRGKAVISTSVGAQGLPPAVLKSFVVADDSASFAAATAGLLRDLKRRAEFEYAASRAAALLPTWDQAACALTEIYDELLPVPMPRMLDAVAGSLA